MLNSIEESPLHDIVSPKSIALMGASTGFSMGTVILNRLQEIGFEGNIYPVHPKADEIRGLKAYASILDVPEPPDLAVMVLPAPTAVQTLEECGRRGVKNAVVVSGGFREVKGVGEDLEKDLLETAGRHNMRLVGPNCLGVAAPRYKMNTTTFPLFSKPGSVGLISQSGSFVTQMFQQVESLGIGLSAAFSTGNESDLDLVDCLEYLGACPHTKVIGLYLEGIRRGRDFVRVARSIVPDKPVVAYYVGGSETGRRAGYSHTGALAGPDGLYEGVFRQAGIVRARSVMELFDFCAGLSLMPPPAGSRVAVLTDSGGPGAAAADACGRTGLELPGFSPETGEKLSPFIPATGSVNNPVDLTFYKNPDDYTTNIPEILLQDPNVDMLLMYFLMPREIVSIAMKSMGVPADQAEAESDNMLKNQYKSIADLIKNNPKPIIGYTFRNQEDPGIKVLTECGLPVFQGAERAARATYALAAYTDLRNKVAKSLNASST